MGLDVEELLSDQRKLLIMQLLLHFVENTKASPAPSPNQNISSLTPHVSKWSKNGVVFAFFIGLDTFGAND
jgi:hypothetical protein